MNSLPPPWVLGVELWWSGSDKTCKFYLLNPPPNSVHLLVRHIPSHPYCATPPPPPRKKTQQGKKASKQKQEQKPEQNKKPTGNRKISAFCYFQRTCFWRLGAPLGLVGEIS